LHDVTIVTVRILCARESQRGLKLDMSRNQGQIFKYKSNIRFVEDNCYIKEKKHNERKVRDSLALPGSSPIRILRPDHKNNNQVGR
jgi:hypothetical protein